MKSAVFTEPQQGATHATLSRVAVTAEELGYDAFLRSDHLLKMGDVTGLPGPTEAWTNLAGLARDTSTIRLGTLVSPVTFRHPGIFAVQVAQVDEMSGGRLDLGLGTGWFEEEHTTHGVPFGSGFAERFERLEEQIEILLAMWRTPASETFTHEGRHYRLVDCPALPEPVQTDAEGRPAIPIVIGGFGKVKTPRLVARYASEFNMPYPQLDVWVEQTDRVREACADHGRDPDELEWSFWLPICVGRDDAEVRRRAEAIGRDADELVETAFGGSPEQVVDRIGRFREAGATKVGFQMLDLSDLDHIELVKHEVVDRLG